MERGILRPRPQRIERHRPYPSRRRSTSVVLTCYLRVARYYAARAASSRSPERWAGQAGGSARKPCGRGPRLQAPPRPAERPPARPRPARRSAGRASPSAGEDGPPHRPWPRASCRCRSRGSAGRRVAGARSARSPGRQAERRAGARSSSSPSSGRLISMRRTDRPAEPGRVTRGRARPGRCSAAGRTRSRRRRRPADCAQIRPSCASTIRLQTASPTPTPPAVRRASSDRKNGVNTSSAMSVGIPIPRSRIRTVAVPSSSPTSTSIGSPGRAVLVGVAQEVLDRACRARSSRPGRSATMRRPTSRMTRSGRRADARLDGRPHDVVEDVRLAVELRPGAEARELEEVLDDPEEAVGVVADVADHVGFGAVEPSSAAAAGPALP